MYPATFYILPILGAIVHLVSGTSISTTRPGCSDIEPSLRGVKLIFEDAKIPSDMNTKFEPQGLLGVTWPSPTDSNDLVYTYPGRHLFDNVTSAVPTFTIEGFPYHKNGPFVIIMFDPDVPATEKPSIRNYIGASYYLDNRDGTLKNRTASIASWRRPSPPRRSQQERYVLFMYDQPPSFDVTDNLDNTTYRNFDIADYADKHGLGYPIAGTFFNIESNASCWREGC